MSRTEEVYDASQGHLCLVARERALLKVWLAEFLSLGRDRGKIKTWYPFL